MSKKNCAHRIVVIASILMLSFAPVTFAAEGSDSVTDTVQSLLESIVEAVDELFGGDDDTPEDDDGGPNFGPDVDPFG